jgi:photosystem II stability/assembly factor-like uncharacterized protein
MSRIAGICTLASLFVTLFISQIHSTQAVTPLAPVFGEETADWTCWNVGTVDPCQNRFRSVDFLHADYGWAVGSNYDTWHWDGTSWQAIPISATVNLIAVSIVAENEVWAAASAMTSFFPLVYDSAFYRWNGLSWQEVGIPEAESIGLITGLKMIATDFGLAVGNQGILRWDGLAWSKIYDNSAYAVDLLAPDDGWAVGSEGRILRWDGNDFTLYDNPFVIPSAALYDVHMLATDEVWITGDLRSIGFWNGVEWIVTPAPPAPGDPRVIHMVGSDDGWIIAADPSISSWTYLWRWDGNEWSVANDSLPAERLLLHDIHMVNETTGWLGGARGLILKWDGANWNTVANQVLPSWPLQTTFYAVDSVAVTAVWAVGHAPNQAVIVRWNGLRWTAETITPSFAGILRDLVMVSPNEGWAVGQGGFVFRRSGGPTWTQVDTPIQFANLHGVTAVADQVWIVGRDTFMSAGLIWRWDGENWHSFETNTNHTLHDISMLNSSEGWAVGDESTILRWDGQAWLSVTNPLTGTLNAVHALAADDVWVAGGLMDPFASQGILARWDGVEWHEIALPENTGTLRDLDFLAPDNGLAVGETAVLRWDGHNWHQATTEAPPRAWGGILTGPDGGWTVGLRFMASGIEPIELDQAVYLPIIIR